MPLFPGLSLFSEAMPTLPMNNRPNVPSSKGTLKPLNSSSRIPFCGYSPSFICSNFIPYYLSTYSTTPTTHTHTSIWRGNKGLCSRESDIHAFFTWGLNLWICYTGRHTMLRSVYHCSFLVSVFVMMLFLLRKVMELSNVNCVQCIHRKMSILPVCESEILYTMYTVSPVWYLSYVLKQPMFKKISFLTC